MYVDLPELQEGNLTDNNSFLPTCSSDWSESSKPW